MTTKQQINKVLTLSVVAAGIVGLMTTTAQADTIVYQDTFDNDGLATSTGIGGGLGSYDRQGGPWIDNGDLDSNRTGNNDRGNVYSLNTFDLTGGFKLEVTHTINNVTTIDANRAVIGLLDANDLPAVQDNTTYATDFLNRDLDKYGIGLNLTLQNATQGLNFADGANLNQLSNAQTIATGTHSWVLEVDAAGNWSYSIDGAPATTGTSAFDVARAYHFFAYMQDNHNHLVINSVTLTQVAAAAQEGPYTYTVTNGHATITGFNSAHSGSLSITNTLGGCPVTIIGSFAFRSCSLTSVTIPDGVTAIGNGAFSDCTSLTRVTIPDSVTVVGNLAFADCTSLARVYFTGNAPHVPGLISVFPGADNSTVYYLPGTTGWGVNYDSRPAVLWNPVFTTVDLTAGVISCTVTGTPNIPIAVEAHTDLLIGQWLRLHITNLTSGSLRFSDLGFTNFPAGFYRITGP